MKLSPRRVSGWIGLTMAAALMTGLVAPQEGPTPYISALAGLGAAPAFAAPSCGFKACAKEPGRKTPDCHRTTQATNCVKSSTGCLIESC